MAGNFEGIKNRRFGIEIEMTGITRCSAAKAGSWSFVELPISSPTKMQKILFCCGSCIREIFQGLDHYEGFPNSCFKEKVEFELNGEKCVGMAYLMNATPFPVCCYV